MTKSKAKTAAKVKTKTAEQSLESILMNCRNALRGTVGGNENEREWGKY